MLPLSIQFQKYPKYNSQANTTVKTCYLCSDNFKNTTLDLWTPYYSFLFRVEQYVIHSLAKITIKNFNIKKVTEYMCDTKKNRLNFLNQILNNKELKNKKQK